MPVTRDLVDSTRIRRAAGHWVGSVNVDAVMAGQDDRPVIIVELSGEEECAGKAVIFRAMVSVVFVGRNGVATETAVFGHIRWKLVVVAEDDRFAVTANRQFRRNGAVEGPHCQRTLIGKIG